jgi:hypothetical protein
MQCIFAAILFFYSFPIFSECSVCFEFYYIQYRFDTKSFKGYVSIPPDVEGLDYYVTSSPNLEIINEKSIFKVIKSLKEVEICDQIQRIRINESTPAFAYICKKGYKKIPNRKFKYAIILNKEGLQNYSKRLKSEKSFLK